MKWGTNLDLNKNELQNFKLQNLAIAPTSPALGQPYYNTTDSIAYIWNGAAWKNLFSMSIEEIVTLINNSNLKIDDDNLSSNVNDAISKRHGHSNKAILDAITQTFIDKWNASESNAKQYANSIKPTKTSQLTNDSDFATNKSVDEKVNNYKVKPATKDVLGGIKVGANLSISDDGILNANDNPASFIPRQEVLIVQPGQTVFNLKKGSYKPNTGTICWFIEGSKQSNDVLQELSSTSFSIKGGLDSGTEIIVEYLELINASPYPVHAKEHLPGGVDAIPKATDNTDGLMGKEQVQKLSQTQTEIENIKKALDDDGDGQIVDTIANIKEQWSRADGELKNLIDGKETPAGAQAKANTAENNAKAVANAHAGDTTRHITANERTYWNSRTGKAAFNIGDTKSTEFILKHNFNTRDLAIGIEEITTGETIFTDVLKIDANTIKVLFAQPPTSNQYRVTIVG